MTDFDQLTEALQAAPSRYTTALEAVLLACHFDRYSPATGRQLGVAVDAFRQEHRSLSPFDREAALRRSPCVVWALLIHADALLSPSLPPHLVPAAALPQDRLPTRKEWFAPGAYPPSAAGPVPRSHAAVLRSVMDAPARPEDGQAGEVWRTWQRMAGYFLMSIAELFPSDYAPVDYVSPYATPRAPAFRVEPMLFGSQTTSRRASEPAGLRPDIGALLQARPDAPLKSKGPALTESEVAAILQNKLRFV